MTLHTEIPGNDRVVTHHRKLVPEFLEGGHLFGDKVVVGHRDDRNVEPNPFPYLAGIGAGGIDDNIARERPVFGVNPPGAIVELNGIGDPGIADERCTAATGSGGEGHRTTGRVEMTVVRCVEGRNHPIEVVERVKLGDSIRPDELHAIPYSTAHRDDVLEPIELLVVVGETQ